MKHEAELSVPVPSVLRKKLETRILEVAELMLVGGAEVSRVEDTVSRMAEAYGCMSADVYATPGMILVTFRETDGSTHTECCRIHSQSTDMAKLEACNALSRKVTRNPIPYEEFAAEVERIKKIHGYSNYVLFAAYGVMTGSLSLLLGGNLRDSICAACCGLLLYIVLYTLRSLELKELMVTLIACLVLGLVAVGLVYEGLGISSDRIIIGIIMPMVPGLALVTALRDMINGDLISGVTGLLAALIRASMLAVGFALAVYIWRHWGYSEPQILSVRSAREQMLPAILPCILTSVTGAVVFHVTGVKKHVVMGIGAVAGFEIYLQILDLNGSAIQAVFMGTLAVMLFAELSARILRTPVTAIMIPMLFPLLPGADLYRTMMAFVNGSMDSFDVLLRILAGEAGGMAVAILLAASMEKLLLKLLAAD